MPCIPLLATQRANATEKMCEIPKEREQRGKERKGGRTEERKRQIWLLSSQASHAWRIREADAPTKETTSCTPENLKNYPPSLPPALLLSVSYPHFASFMAPSVVSRSEYFRPSSVRKPMNGRWEHTIAALSSLGVHLDAPTRIIFTSDQRLSVSLSLPPSLFFPSFPLSPFLLSPSSFAHDADSAALRVRSLVTFPASNPKLSFRPAWRDDDANFT